jgi:hypothetical protein
MNYLTTITDTIDRNAMFLNFVPKKQIKFINGEKVLILKENSSITIQTEFKKIVIIPFVDGMFGFGIDYLDKKFFTPVNFVLNVNREFKKLYQYFDSYFIENILENIHKNISG